VIWRPLPQISATIRGVIDQAPSPTSLLLITNPANRIGSVPGWYPRPSRAAAWRACSGVQFRPGM
jgi:hypothetical protein